jgi:hypothetical protein
MTTLPPPPCPGCETIASFLERRLALTEADAVARHLATCDECGTVFAESSAYVRGDPAREDDSAARSASIARRARRQWLSLGVAASLVIGLTVWSVERLRKPPPEPSEVAVTQPHRDPVSTLIADVDPAVLAGLIDAREPVRPRGFQAERPQAAGMRRGVLLADLGVARAARMPDLVAALEARLARTGAELPARDVDDGRFLEACRLAARSRADAFLARPEVRARIQAIAQRTDDAAVAERLRSIGPFLQAGDRGDAEWQQIVQTLDLVLAALS